MTKRAQIIDEGHEQTQFVTGGRREIIPGKGRFDLIPPEPITESSQHFEAGANKYAERNWEQGLPLSTFYNSLSRHLRDWYMYGKTDENHLAALVWNAMCALATQRRIDAGTLPASLDTRPATAITNWNCSLGGTVDTADSKPAALTA